MSKKIGYDEWMKEIHKEAPDIRRKWTDEEMRFIRDTKAEGYNTDKISRAMGGKRSRSAISNKLGNMNR